MYSDIFDQLGVTTGAGASGAAETNDEDDKNVLVRCKAGRVTLDWQKDNKYYECTPQTERGEIRLVVMQEEDRGLHWQWYDRRLNKVQETHKIEPDSNTTFERVLPKTQDEKDRIYVWTRSSSKEESKVEHDMYWMQDAATEKEDETVALINQYLADPASAKVEGDDAMNTSDAAAAGTSTTDQAQVDALSSILENLGMPQGTGGSAGAASSGGAAAAEGHTLTQADLAAAMAGIQQGGGSEGGVVTSLSDVVTPTALRDLILEGDDDLQQRLIALLPEGQQTKEYLEENLQSPQLQATLRSLSAAIVPDRATGNLDGFLSLLANFEYEPPSDMTAAQTNPLQTFLECVLEKVEREKEASEDRELAEEEAEEELQPQE